MGTCREYNCWPNQDVNVETPKSLSGVVVRGVASPQFSCGVLQPRTGTDAYDDEDLYGWCTEEPAAKCSVKQLKALSFYFATICGRYAMFSSLSKQPFHYTIDPLCSNL